MRRPSQCENVTASSTLVRRTQRAVREQTIAMAEGRQRSRRGMGIAALVAKRWLIRRHRGG